jgi:sec-independent protein translocase protein TatA
MLAPQIALLDIGTPELIIILVIILVLFGSKKLPELSKSLGQSMHELRKGMSEDSQNQKNNKNEKDNQKEPPRPSAPTSA